MNWTLIAELVSMARSYPEIANDMIAIMRRLLDADQAINDKYRVTKDEYALLVMHGTKVHAIKAYRDRTGVSLTQAMAVIKNCKRLANHDFDPMPMINDARTYLDKMTEY